MKKLIITEKANAARRISTILSDGSAKSETSGGVTVISFETGNDQYSVVSLRGHILELDYPSQYNDWSACSPVELVRAPQLKTVRVKNILTRIKELAVVSDMIIIATDYDREGELIGMETVKAVEVDLSKVKRAKFSALTKGEVEKAFSDLVDPDEKLADAAEARQIVDLCWGAVLTRLISLSSGQVGKNFMSVGRVQSPTLKLLVDRHEEIENFIPVPFWNIVAKFGDQGFKGTHEKNPFWNKEEAEAVLDHIGRTDTGTVVKYESTQKDEYRLTPFDTTTMQVEANKIGIPPTTAMKLAEELYTGGYISYPRTENTEYPRSLGLRSVLEKLKDSDDFAKEATELLSQEKILPSRGSRRTTDHPPIYPTAGVSSDKLKGDKWKLYELIVRRFMVTVAPNAKAEITDIGIDVDGEIFEAQGYVQTDPGWKKYYRKYLKITETKMPELAVGDVIAVSDKTMDESETKPPYRYNQGSLIQEMDRLQLGTKSTRHDIISKLYSRNYVQGNYLVPTSSGIALTRSLEKHGGGITEPEMTAKLEEDMLKISDGEFTLDEVVKQSQDMLYQVAVKISDESNAIGTEIKEALRSQQFVGTCPTCGKNMIIKKSKNGNFIGCEGYPDCTKAYPMPRGAMVQTTDSTCPSCGLPQLKVIRKGTPPSMQCIDPACESNTSKTDLGVCPTCGEGRIRMMYSKAGKRFAGCSQWPKCTQTYPLRPTGNILTTDKKCEECGSPMIVFNARLECINPDCSTKKKKTATSEKKTATKSTTRKTAKKTAE